MKTHLKAEQSMVFHLEMTDTFIYLKKKNVFIYLKNIYIFLSKLFESPKSIYVCTVFSVGFTF